MNKHRVLPCENLRVVIGIAEYKTNQYQCSTIWIDEEYRESPKKRNTSDEIEIVFQFRADWQERKRWVILKISTAVDRQKRNAIDLAEK